MKKRPSKPKPPPEKKTIQQVTRAAIIAGLSNGASVGRACQAANLNRATFYEWCNTDAGFKKQVDEAKESLIGVAEDCLVIEMKKGKGWAICFFLCNRAPDRWKNIQKVEASILNEIPITFVPYKPANHAKPDAST